jgi:RimJ/RimL family protein N-acetyltransferase
MIRPQFLEAATQQRELKNTVEEVFVCFGGADMYDLSFKATQALLTFRHIKHIHIVLGGAYKHEAIIALKEANSERISLHRNITAEQMLTVMNKSDFAIAPASTIIYELCCVTMPILGGYYVENQRQIYEGLLSSKVIHEGGDFSNDTEDSFRIKISGCFNNNRQEQCANQLALFDGTVKRRVVKLADAYSKTYTIRKADDNDLQLFFDWANDSLTRKMSFSSDPIKLEDHTQWYHNQLKKEKTYLLILDVETETGSAPVGNIKFDSDGVIGISLDAAYRGKGLGALLINKGLEYIATTKQYPSIFAFIKESNTSSRTIFEQAGFAFTKMTEVRGVPCLEYQYPLTN